MPDIVVVLGDVPQPVPSSAIVEEEDAQEDHNGEAQDEPDDAQDRGKDGRQGEGLRGGEGWGGRRGGRGEYSICAGKLMRNHERV